MQPSNPLQILVLCTANSARSQMAEGLLRDKLGHRADVFSAGAQPSFVKPHAIRAMQAIDIDISNHTSDGIDQYIGQSFDYVITVCNHAAETCRVFSGKANRVHYDIPDPLTEGSDAVIYQSFVTARNMLDDHLNKFVASLTE